MSIDRWLFMRLFGVSMEYPLIGRIMVRITKGSSSLFFILYLGMIGLLLWGRDPRLVPFLIGPASVLVIVKAIRRFYFRPRPFQTLHITSLIEHETNSSLPSQHSSSAFVIALAVWHIYPYLGTLFLGLALITGLSRVMVGVHYPLDILSGAGLGLIMGQLVFRVVGDLTFRLLYVL